VSGEDQGRSGEWKPGRNLTLRSGFTETWARLSGPSGRTLGTSLAIQGLLIVTGVVAARTLGVTGRGDFALLWVGPMAIVLIGGIGLPKATAFFAARAKTPREERAVIESALKATLPLAVIFTALYLIAVEILTASGNSIREPAFVSALLVPLLLTQGLGVNALQGMQQFNWFNLCRLLPLLTYAPLAALSWIFGFANLLSLISLFVGSYILATTVTWVSVRRLLPAGTPATAHFPVTQLLSFGLRGMLSNRNMAEHLRLDQLAVGLLNDARGLGLYASAASFANLPRFIAQSIGAVAFPRIAAARNGASERKLTRRALRIGVAGIALVVIVIEAALPFLIELFFGSDFLPAVPIGRVLLIGAGILAVKLLVTDILLGLGHPGYGSVAELINLVGLLIALAAIEVASGLSPLTVAWVVLGIAALSTLYLLVVFTRVSAGRWGAGHSETMPR